MIKETRGQRQEWVKICKQIQDSLNEVGYREGRGALETHPASADTEQVKRKASKLH